MEREIAVPRAETEQINIMIETKECGIAIRGERKTSHEFFCAFARS